MAPPKDAGTGPEAAASAPTAASLPPWVLALLIGLGGGGVGGLGTTVLSAQLDPVLDDVDDIETHLREHKHPVADRRLDEVEHDQELTAEALDKLRVNQLRICVALNVDCER